MLSKAIKETNSSKTDNFIQSSSKIFELSKIGSNQMKNREIVPVCSTWRRDWDDFRTFKWADSIDNPELMMKQINELLKSNPNNPIAG